MSTEQDPSGLEPTSPTDDPLVVPRDAPGSDLESPSTAQTEPFSADSAPASEERPAAPEPSRNMLPGRERRRSRFERLIVRLIATGGVVAIGVAIAAIMASSNSHGWLIGLVVSIVTVILSGLLWSSKQL